MTRIVSRVFALVVVLLVLSPPVARADGTAFLVLAPDRGFLGNEETRDAFESYLEGTPNSVLAFATDERTAENLEQSLAELREVAGSYDQVVVLPLFVTEHEALFVKAREALSRLQISNLEIAEPFGSSYLAEELLFDRVRALLPEDFKSAGHSGHGGHGGHGGGHDAHTGRATTTAVDPVQHGVPRLVVVASGAATVDDANAIIQAVEPMARRAAEKFGLADAGVTVIYDWSASSEDAAAGFANTIQTVKAAAEHGPALVVPFNFSRRLTTMMADWTRLEGGLAAIDGAKHDGVGIIPHENVARWLTRTANSYLPLTQDDIGIILVPHGSDYNWNQAMRAAMAPIRDRYVTEEAFSMVDPFVVERAVRKLEKKGVKAAVLLRIFSLESSFKNQAEYVLGLRPEYRGPHAERISSHLLFSTTGGMEAHPLLQEAMLERALEVSENPSRETVVLVAHGTGGDAQNEHWLKNLATIADYIRSHNPDFRDVKFHTLREDWPDKREASVEALRASVEKASENGGIALVIPVRTIDQGPEAAFLEGLTFRHGTGFAPHVKFVQWLEETIQDGVSILKADEDVAQTTSTTADDRGMVHSRH